MKTNNVISLGVMIFWVFSCVANKYVIPFPDNKVKVVLPKGTKVRSREEIKKKYDVNFIYDNPGSRYFSVRDKAFIALSTEKESNPDLLAFKKTMEDYYADEGIKRGVVLLRSEIVKKGDLNVYIMITCNEQKGIYFSTISYHTGPDLYTIRIKFKNENKTEGFEVVNYILDFLKVMKY